MTARFADMRPFCPIIRAPGDCSSDWARTILVTLVHVVRKPEGQHGFAVMPRRWCVERTLAWLTAHRRLARDYERDPATSEAMIRRAAIDTMTSRIARDEPATRRQRWHWPDESRPRLSHAPRETPRLARGPH